MQKRNRVLLATAVLAVSVVAYAVTGLSNLTAASSGPVYGYIQGQVGSMSSPILSDGKVIKALLTSGSTLALKISGFASDPGKSYFNNLVVNCVSGPTVHSSASAGTYSYFSGQANWSWTRASPCMQSPTTSYLVSVN